MGSSANALPAPPARRDETGNNLVAGSNPRHVLADFGDGTGALMAEHDRQLERILTVLSREVGMTDAARPHSNPDVVIPEREVLDFPDNERAVELFQYDGSHDFLLLTPSSDAPSRADWHNGPVGARQNASVVIPLNYSKGALPDQLEGLQIEGLLRMANGHEREHVVAPFGLLGHDRGEDRQ